MKCRKEGFIDSLSCSERLELNNPNYVDKEIRFLAEAQ